jgi:prepilin-type N-terminal cleavage/methylation domain-containing protein
LGGFTLVECLIALAIAATCLTALIVARTDAVAQAHRATLVAAATDYARHLATAARVNGIVAGETATGSIETPHPLRYRQTCRPITPAAKVQLVELTVEVFDRSEEHALCEVTLWLPASAVTERPRRPDGGQRDDRSAATDEPPAVVLAAQDRNVKLFPAPFRNTRIGRN